MTESPSIAFVIDRYFEFGGLQRDCLRIATACAEKGNKVTIITGQWVGERPDNITIEEVDTSAISNTGKLAKLEQAMERIRFSKSFDCVVGFKKITGLDIYYAGDPCLADKLKGSSVFKRLLPRYKKLLKNEAAVFGSGSKTKILLIAHQEQQKFTDNYGTTGDRFSLLPPGIDRERLTGHEYNENECKQLRAEHGVNQDDLFLLQVGSAFRTKGLDRSISAIAALPETLKEKVKLVIVGAGDVSPYKAMAAQLKLSEQVIFTGPQKDVASFYHCADLLIHPAITENTGTVLLEAMVCGLPVLTTGNCGYSSHVLKAQAGAVSPMPFNQTAFNMLLESMLEKTKLEKWVANGRQYSQTEDLYSMINEAANLIHDFAQKQEQAK